MERLDILNLIISMIVYVSLIINSILISTNGILVY